MGLSQEAYTSRIIFNTIDLRQLVEASTWIVEADCVEEKGALPPGSGDVTYACQVKRIMSARTAPLVPGEKILVHSAGWSLHAKLTRDRQEKGISRSAPLDRFRGDHSERMEHPITVILFLIKGIPNNPGYELAAQNGFVEIDQREEVEKILTTTFPKKYPAYVPVPSHSINGKSVTVEEFDRILSNLKIIPGTEVNGESPKGLFTSAQWEDSQHRRYYVKQDGEDREITGPWPR